MMSDDKQSESEFYSTLITYSFRITGIQSSNELVPDKKNETGKQLLISHIINYSLTSNVQSLRGKFIPWPCHINPNITRSTLQGFPAMTSLLVNK